MLNFEPIRATIPKIRLHVGEFRHRGSGQASRDQAHFQKDLPTSVRGVIQRKIQRLGEDRALLLAAAVQGCEVDSAVVAKVLGVDARTVEDWPERVESDHKFVRHCGEQDLPDRRNGKRWQLRLDFSLRDSRQRT